MLNWRSTGNRSTVKGTVLASALYGPQSRFLICEQRTREPGEYVYGVRDAAKRSDAQVREGKFPLVYYAGSFFTVEEALAFCDATVAREESDRAARLARMRA